MPRLRLALAGGLAALVALATTVLLDGISTSVPSLVLGVGQAVIRWSPGSVARGGVEAVGTADKPLLVAGIVVVSVLLGARAGVAGGRRPWLFPGTVAVAALVGVLATVGATEARIVGSTIAAVVSAGAGIATYAVLRRAADDTRPTPSLAPIGAAVGRRRFLTVGMAAAGGAALTAAVGRTLLRNSAADAQRASVTLPRAPDRQPAVTGTGFDVDGLSPFVTPNEDFYRIDEALVVPAVDLDGWKLRFTGSVANPFELTYDELKDLATLERYVTIACVSNEIGGELIGNARWLGVPLAELLDRAGVDPGATQIVGRSVDGFTVGFPVETALDGRDAMVAIGMNGEPLPRKHGFPARLIVPGLYGYVSATKWLTEVELTTFEDFDAYWVRRGWAQQAPIKLQSRIDVPRSGAAVTAGHVAVAGVAWAQQRGIDGVQLRLDGGDWQDATLATEQSVDTWRQWRFDWDAEPGRYQLEVRARSKAGEVQDETRRSVFPDGATGFHRIIVTVEDAASA